MSDPNSAMFGIQKSNEYLLQCIPPTPLTNILCTYANAQQSVMHASLFGVHVFLHHRFMFCYILAQILGPPFHQKSHSRTSRGMDISLGPEVEKNASVSYSVI